MADVLCDVTQLPKIQKWVTLQPNKNYNTYKSCNTNHRLDIKAIADEISNELRPSLTLDEFNQQAGRFPERVRATSGRAISQTNRLRNSIFSPRKSQRFSNVKVGNINSRPKSVRFNAADVIRAPPQLTGRPLRPPRSDLPTSAIEDTRFGNRRPSASKAKSEPRRVQSFRFLSRPNKFQPAVTSFIEQQRSRNENNFSLRQASSDAVFSKRTNNEGFSPANKCPFGFCR